MTARPALTAWLLAIMLGGCGGEPDVTVTRSEVDTHFATADALVAYFNELTTTAPADVRAVCDLYYAENELQEQYIVEHREYVGVLEVHDALYRRFGRGYFPDMEFAFAPNGPAVIADRGPTRATATYTDKDGEVKTLELVKAGERWWLSANVLEEVRAGITEEHMREVVMVFRGISDAGRDIIPRIEAGEFETFEEAGRALWTRAVQLEPELRAHIRGGDADAGGGG